MATILFDQPYLRKSLLPFSYLRPVSEIRVGIMTISEKWRRYLEKEIYWSTENYLNEKYSFKEDENYTYINGGLIPNEKLIPAITNLKLNEALICGDNILAFNTNKELNFESIKNEIEKYAKIDFEGNYLMIDKVWKIFRNNGEEITHDLKFFNHLKGKKIDDLHTIVYNSENIYVENGAKIRAAILNGENGPIYLGKNSEINEGAVIRGPFALCEGSIVNVGAKIIGDNTVGPYSKVGGEMSNSVIFGYSNKSHDGFLGNSVIGEWCNIGADTNTSNLKNNYQKVKLWDYSTEKFENTGLQFCGLMMGDHAKCGINTMFNTATVVGVGANVFGEGFLRNFIPSFAWGGSSGYSTFQFDKFIDMTKTVYERRNRVLDENEIKILIEAYQLSAKHRFWEKA